MGSLFNNKPTKTGILIGAIAGGALGFFAEDQKVLPMAIYFALGGALAGTVINQVSYQNKIRNGADD